MIMRRNRVQWLIFLSLILVWVLSLSAQSKIYWLSDTGSTRTFYRANTDGSQIEKLATVLYSDQMHNFVIDTLRQRFYVAWHAGRIYSYSFDGQISEQLLKKTIEKDNKTYGPYALTWHRKSDKLYFSVANTIYRCDMDGSHVEVVFESTGAITDIQIDEENDRIFWASSATNRKQNSTIFTANLDGSSKRALYSGNLEYVLDIKHISLYLTEEHLYFSWGVWGGGYFSS
ncbi:DUF5050 domain-containing protein [candidate division KSB1 bacterium]|nr:DUF5050 domain-containing protein [candidate division KSB1 bacterium]